MQRDDGYVEVSKSQSSYLTKEIFFVAKVVFLEALRSKYDMGITGVALIQSGVGDPKWTLHDPEIFDTFTL